MYHPSRGRQLVRGFQLVAVDNARGDHFAPDQAFVFLYCKAVSHAGDIVRHDPRQGRLVRCVRHVLAPLLCQFVSVLQEKREQIVDHLRHNNPHFNDCWRTVHPFKQELANDFQICPKLW